MTSQQDKTASERQICLGVITGASGIQGEVKIKPYTGDPQDVGAYGPVDLVGEGGGAQTGVGVKITRFAKDAVIARFEGVEGRDAAEALRGLEMYVNRAVLPGEEEDEYYHADLVGLTVEDLEGATLGTVMAVYDFGAGEMLEVNLSSGHLGGGTAMLPFTKAAVPQVLIGEGRIIADPPDGVLPKPKAPKDMTRGAKSGKRKVKPKAEGGRGEDV